MGEKRWTIHGIWGSVKNSGQVIILYMNDHNIHIILIPAPAWPESEYLNHGKNQVMMLTKRFFAQWMSHRDKC